jgi:hypothetical protein
MLRYAHQTVCIAYYLLNQLFLEVNRKQNLGQASYFQTEENFHAESMFNYREIKSQIIGTIFQF